jgi:PAS domain S-box-containing protein
MAATAFRIPLRDLAKRFALIYSLIILVFSAVIYAGVVIDRQVRIDNNVVQERSRLEVAKAQIDQDLSVVSTDLRIIANLPLLRSYLDEGAPALRLELEQLLLVFSRETQRYDQVRYIDLSGYEDIRIDFNNGRPLIAASAELQNKSHRYYFTDSIVLKRDSLFVSPLDLNIENKKVEIPYKPMIRYATPVFDSKGEKRGIIILNYFGNQLLENFRAVVKSNNPHGGMLLTKDGYWLKGSKPDDEWGFMFNNTQLTFGHRFPEAWKIIQKGGQGSVLMDDGLFIYLTVLPLPKKWGPAAHNTIDSERNSEDSVSNNYHWKIVSFIPYVQLYQGAFYNQPLGRVLAVIIYLLFAVVAYFIARLTLSRKIAKEEIIQLNEELEQRVAEHAAGEENLAVTLRSIGDGVLTTDELARVTRLNIIAEQLTGWTQAEAIGRPIAQVFQIVNQTTRQPEFIPVEVTLATGVIHELEEETLLVSRNGSERPIADSCAPIRNSAGTVIGAVLVFRDITERKQIEQHLISAKESAERANRTKDSFLATMSHEIRTPLTGMLGMLEVLSMSELDAEQNKTLGVAWDSARSLLRIVNDILDWSKIQEGKLALSPQSTSIPQLLQEVVNTYSRIASTKCLLLSKREDARLSAAHIVDPLRLSQILNNFVSNAIKFTQHGNVELTAELLDQLESGERIRFSVKDTGKGIPLSVQQNLFKRFQQESADTARQYGGTGLGLSICLRLAELLDGQIDVISAPDQGSTFSFTVILPISAAPGEKLPTVTPDVEQKKVAPLITNMVDTPLILAVDDHPINRDLLARQIKLLGLRAETAENGLAALSLWRTGRFALVITDCHMPEMDGYSFTRAIRSIEVNEQRSKTPVIAWTANARTEEKQFCQNAGMDDLLVKPADLAQLKEVLIKWLSIADNAIAQILSNKSINPEPSNGPIDYQELSKVVPEMDEQLAVLQEYSAHIRADFTKLFTEFEQGRSVNNVEQMAHRMKGASKMVGAKQIAAACFAVEQAAKNESIDNVRIHIQQLDAAIEQFEQYLLTVISA